MDTATNKKCYKCKETKSIKSFHNNTAYKDGLNIYCKKCLLNDSLAKRGVTNDLSNEEESLLLKYFPFAHERSRFICRNPKGATPKESKPLSFSDIARDTGMSHGEVQRIFYKFTRLRLATLIVKADEVEEGLIITNVAYKIDNIRDYIFESVS